MSAVDAISLTVPPTAAVGGTVIYEVTLDVERRAAKRFDAWLKQHMRDMCALPGFLGAELVPADQVAAVQEPRTLRRVVRYRLVSRAALDNYLDQHAARLRAESARYFGKQLRSSRRLLDAEGQPLIEDVALLPVTLRCLNCNAVLAGKYCVACGQPSHNYAAPLWADIQDFFGNHFGFDTKLFRSAMPLLFRPGFLSREYSAGRRVRYINPLRLYIFSSILFFLVAWNVTPQNFFHFNQQPAQTSTSAAAASNPLTPAERTEILNSRYLSDAQKQAILQSAAGPKTQSNQQSKASAKPPSGNASGTPNITFTSTDTNTNNVSGTILGRKFSMPRTEFETRMIHTMESNLPKLMFVLLPLVALLLKIFYLRSRHYYMEHLIFALHNHAFIFMTMLVMVLLNLLGRHASWAAAPTHYLNVILGWYIVVYVFLAMLFYYRQSFIKTLGKFLVIGFIYWVALLGVLVGGVMLTLAYVVAS